MFNRFKILNLDFFDIKILDLRVHITYMMPFWCLLPSPVISIRLKWRRSSSHDIYAASHEFLIRLRHYSLDQLYPRKVPDI